jgi:hypothetical protein
VNTATTREGIPITTSVMGKELLTFIDNVEYIRKITITFKDMKRKVTYGTNNSLLKYKPKNVVTMFEHIYRVSHELRSLLRESVPYVKVYQYNQKHLCPKLNGYGDNGQRKVGACCGSTYCTC